MCSWTTLYRYARLKLKKVKKEFLLKLICTISWPLFLNFISCDFSSFLDFNCFLSSPFLLSFTLFADTRDFCVYNCLFRVSNFSIIHQRCDLMVAFLLRFVNMSKVIFSEEWFSQFSLFCVYKLIKSVFTHLPLLTCRVTFSAYSNAGLSFGFSAQQCFIRITSDGCAVGSTLGGTGR